MLAFRITHKLYSKSLIATGMAGRWNANGQKVIYCAESIALAFLENMVRRQGVGFNDDFCTMVLDIPDSLKTQIINQETLETGWRNFHDYSKCQEVGKDWYDAGRFPLLKVPSVVLPSSFNFVINTQHKDFKRIRLLEVADLIPDERIEQILRSHSRS